METVALLLFLMLLRRESPAATTSSAAAHAADVASKATERARRTGHPADARAAAKAQQAAATLATHAAAQATHASALPPAWPTAKPVGLPAFPGPGWVPADPPGGAVVARAWQLLPALWRKGAGATQTEQTAGTWTTYVAAWHGTKKGVNAFRLKGPLGVQA